jgi:hypothetical protein
MAEFWIIGVDHESPSAEPRNRGPIVKVYYAQPEESNKAWASLTTGFECTREKILEWLNAGKSIFTATRDVKYQQIWDKGDVVEPTKNKRYITTKGNDVTYDNLGNLPSVSTVRALFKK